MAKNTFVNTRFWQDTYVADLDPSEKLVFLYLITSPYLSLTGIYEVPLKVVAMETGIDAEMVEKILKRFQQDGKVIYHKGWVCIINYPKYQYFKGGKLQKAIDKEIAAIPSDILKAFKEYGYPIDTLSIVSMERDMEREREMEGGLQRGKQNNASSNSKQETYSEAFIAFWQAYPRKVGKKAAYKAWQKADADNQTLIAAVEAQKQTGQWQKEQGKYIPHPATWLNHGRWEDELETSNKSSKYGGIKTKSL